MAASWPLSLLLLSLQCFLSLSMLCPLPGTACARPAGAWAVPSASSISLEAFSFLLVPQHIHRTLGWVLEGAKMSMVCALMLELI